MSALLPALYRSGKLSWNPTVNKMTALALLKLRDLDRESFTAHAERLFGPKNSDGFRSEDWTTSPGGTMRRRRSSFGKASDAAFTEKQHADPAAAQVYTSSPVYESYHETEGVKREEVCGCGFDPIDEDINKAIKEVSKTLIEAADTGPCDAAGPVHMDVDVPIADDKGEYHAGTKRMRSPPSFTAAEKLFGGESICEKLPPPAGDDDSKGNSTNYREGHNAYPPHVPTHPQPSTAASSMMPPRHGLIKPPIGGAHSIAESKYNVNAQDNLHKSALVGPSAKACSSNSMLGGWKPGSGKSTFKWCSTD
jgi:hypothetical protein